MVEAQARGQAPVAVHRFVLHIERAGGLACVGEALEREHFRWEGGQAGVEVGDVAAHMVQPVGDLVRPATAAQNFVGLHAGLPGALAIGVVAHAQGQGVAYAGADLARLRILVRHDGAHVVCPVGTQAKPGIPGQAVALHGARGVFIDDGTGNLRRGAAQGQGVATGEQVHIRFLLHMLQREHVALSGMGAQHDLAEHGVVAVVLRVGAGAVEIGLVVGAHVVHGVGAAGGGRQHPLQGVAGLACHGTGQGVAVVVTAPARRNAATERFGCFAFADGQEVGRFVRDEVDQPRHAVGAVQGGRRATYHLDALEQFEREVFTVKGGGAEGVAARHAHAIGHQQHPVATQAADVDAYVAIAPGAGGGTAHGKPGRRALDRGVGQVLQRFAQVAALLVAQGVGVDHIVGQRQLVCRLLLPRAADHHLGQCRMGVAWGRALGMCRHHVQTSQGYQNGQGACLGSGRVCRTVDLHVGCFFAWVVGV